MHTVECRCNAVQYNKILHKWLQRHRRISIRCWIHKDTPYLALTGELWGIFCEYLWENWPRFNSTAPYLHFISFPYAERTVSWELSSWKTNAWLSHIVWFGCWCPGSLRRQGFGSRDIDLVRPWVTRVPHGPCVIYSNYGSLGLRSW